MFGKKGWISEHPGAEHRMHLVRKVSARPIHQWSRMVCVSVGQGWPTLCVCVLPQVWGRILPTTDSMSVADYQNHNRVSSKRSTREASHLRKRNWGNCIVCVVLQIIWRLSVSVCFGESQAWIACVISYVLSTFFFKLWHKKSINPSFPPIASIPWLLLFCPDTKAKGSWGVISKGRCLRGKSYFSENLERIFPRNLVCIFPPGNLTQEETYILSRRHLRAGVPNHIVKWRDHMMMHKNAFYILF